jgi:hypothetical protein
MTFLERLSSPFSERVKSPIWGPFIVSWLIINWKVVYVTFFLSGEPLFPFNKLDLIVGLLSINSVLWMPLLALLVFLFIMPWCERQVLRYTEEQKKKALDIKLEISKKHSVPGIHYYSLKEAFETEKKRNAFADEEIAKGTAMIQEMDNNLRQAIQGRQVAEQRISSLESTIARFNERKNIGRVLNGRWLAIYDSNPPLEILIQNNIVSVFKGTVATHAFDLVCIDVDIANQHVQFCKFDAVNKRTYEFHDLKIISDTLLEGQVDRTMFVQLRKQVFTGAGNQAIS